MFERFTERARMVVVLSEDEARTLRHNYIGTEHILLGLLREEEGLAAHVLDSLDITVEDVRTEVARIVGQGDEMTTGQIPFTPRAKKVLELALREALSPGHNYIGTEHILLGLVRENEGVAVQVLLDFDADAERIRSEILRILSRPNRWGREVTVANIQAHGHPPSGRGSEGRTSPGGRQLVIACPNYLAPLETIRAASWAASEGDIDRQAVLPDCVCLWCGEHDVAAGALRGALGLRRHCYI